MWIFDRSFAVSRRLTGPSRRLVSSPRLLKPLSPSKRQRHFSRGSSVAKKDKLLSTDSAFMFLPNTRRDFFQRRSSHSLTLSLARPKSPPPFFFSLSFFLFHSPPTSISLGSSAPHLHPLLAPEDPAGDSSGVVNNSACTMDFFLLFICGRKFLASLNNALTPRSPMCLHRQK